MHKKHTFASYAYFVCKGKIPLSEILGQIYTIVDELINLRYDYFAFGLHTLKRSSKF